MDLASLLFLQQSDGDCYAVVGDVYRFLAEGHATAGRYALFEATVFPGGGPPPHRHTREIESFYIIEGEVVFFVGEERHVAAAGSFIQIPRGQWHNFKNETDSPARMLIHVAPAGIELLFREIGRAPADPKVAPAPPTPEEISRLLTLCPMYGIDLAD